MPVERHFGRAAFGDDPVDADGANAFGVKQLQRRLQNPLARAPPGRRPRAAICKRVAIVCAVARL